MKYRTFAAALAMTGALAVVGTAVGGEAGTCSVATAAAPVTVASAASATASSSVAEPVAANPPAPQPEKQEKADRPAKTDAATPVGPEKAPARPRPRAAAKKPAHAAAAAAPATDAAALAWWSPKVADALNLVYAGEASFSPAIVLLFDGDFEDPALANKVIRVTSDSGAPVPGQWVVATNKRMLLFKARPGRYQVKVGGELVDGAGRKIASAQGGPVTVATR
jgi:hypothetical protein